MIADDKRTLYERLHGTLGLTTFLHQFYADVRQHDVIGPIFNEKIQDWPAHIAKIAGFWARVTGGPSTYSGQMPVKHMNLGLQPQHFKIWLQIWDANCSAHLPKQEGEELSRVAHEIGDRLQMILNS